MTMVRDSTRHRWDDLPEDRPMDKIARRRIIGEHVMLSQVALEKGFNVPSHSHANEQIACVIKGKVRFGLGEPDSADHSVETLEGGEVLVLPPNVPHSAEALEDSIVLDVFSPPSETTGIDRK